MVCLRLPARLPPLLLRLPPRLPPLFLLISSTMLLPLLRLSSIILAPLLVRILLILLPLASLMKPLVVDDCMAPPALDRTTPPLPRRPVVDDVELFLSSQSLSDVSPPIEPRTNEVRLLKQTFGNYTYFM